MTKKKLITVEYDSNNSGGSWWLRDEDWKKLEGAGWKVKWFSKQKKDKWLPAGKDGRWLGALATKATIKATSVEVAKAMWEETLGYNADAEGCDCCGQPHNFYQEY